MDAQEWARFYNEYLVNAEILETAPFSEADITAMGKGMDWQKEFFQNAPIMNHNINVSGGTDDLKYFVSGSAMTKDGLIPNSYYNKYNLRSSLDMTMSKMITASVSMAIV